MIDKQTIERLSALPIEGVAERLGLRVSRHKCLCPFHADSHPSLTFNVRTNRYRCYVCGEYGRTIDLAMKMLNRNFADTCHWLADEHNMIIEQWKPAQKEQREYPPDVAYLTSLVAHPVLNAEAQHFLFDQRKIDPRVVRWCGLTSINVPMPCWRNGRPFYDAPSLLIPYRDVDGRLLSVQGRYLGAQPSADNAPAGSLPNGRAGGGSIPRFRFPRNSHCPIYNLPVLSLLQAGEPLYITEGCSDCWAMLSSGHKAIAIPSATLLKEQDIELLKALNSRLQTTFHIFPDQDEPGERLFLQLRSLLPNIERHQLPVGCKDFGAFYAQSLFCDSVKA